MAFDYEAFLRKLRSNPEAQKKFNNNLFTVSAMPTPFDTPESIKAKTEKMVEEQKIRIATPRPQKTQTVEDYKKEIERENKLRELAERRRAGIDTSKDVLLVNNRFMITNDLEDGNPRFPRPLQGRGLDYEDLQEFIDDTIYELLPIPTSLTLPVDPPVSGDPTINKIYVANWGMLADFGGSTDATKDLSNPQVRRNNHYWPAIYGISPVYRFFTGDNPLFYVYNPVSYIHPETGEQVVADDIIWKLDGQEVKRGKSFQMYEVSPTEARKALTVEIRNEVGVKTETIFYEIKDSDDFSDVEGFSSTFKGSFNYNPDAADGKGLAIFEEGATIVNTVTDPVTGETKEVVTQVTDAYEPRWLKFKVKWNDYGNGRNKRKKFRKSTPSVKIDGVEYNTGNKLCRNINGAKYGKHNGQDMQDTTYYVQKPPGPLTMIITTSFDYTRKRKREFKLELDYNIKLDDPAGSVIDLGTLNIGKKDFPKR